LANGDRQGATVSNGSRDSKDRKEFSIKALKKRVTELEDRLEAEQKLNEKLQKKIIQMKKYSEDDEEDGDVEVTIQTEAAPLKEKLIEVEYKKKKDNSCPQLLCEGTMSTFIIEAPNKKIPWRVCSKCKFKERIRTADENA
jgi:hypothetical protein